MIVSVHKLWTDQFCGFHALEVEFFQLNMLHLRPGCLYTPVDCHRMPKRDMVDSPMQVLYKLVESSAEDGTLNREQGHR